MAEYYLHELLEIKPIARDDRSALVRFCRKAMSTLKTLESLDRTQVSFLICSKDGRVTKEIKNCWSCPGIRIENPIIDAEKLNEWPHLHGAHTPKTNLNAASLLIGMDDPSYHAIFDQKICSTNDWASVAHLTPFGWTIIGPPSGKENNNQVNQISVGNGLQLDHLLQQFFSEDAFGVKPDVKQPTSPDEMRAVDILSKTCRFNGERFAREPAVGERYAAVMNEYIALGHAKEMTASEEVNEIIGKTWWLPYHAVINPNKPGKVRVVFDAAAKFHGVSLNEAFLKGSDLLTSLVRVLIRFRQFPIAVSADIVKMFHQVRVPEEDCSALRFLWRNPGSGDKIRTYQMKVQIFGAVSSPTICAYAARQAQAQMGVRHLLRRQPQGTHSFVRVVL